MDERLAVKALAEPHRLRPGDRVLWYGPGGVEHYAVVREIRIHDVPARFGHETVGTIVGDDGSSFDVPLDQVVNVLA